MDGPEFDEAILGVAAQAGRSTYVVIYDVGRVLKVLEREMSYDEAREYFDFNVACAYVGEQTPIYLDTWP